jgi:hypothetical protein
MSLLSRSVRTIAIAVVSTIGFSLAAAADDFVKECKIGNPGPTADKVCDCMSDKVKGSDRADAIDAMAKTNVAVSKGTTADASIMTPKYVKSLEVLMTAQAGCM